MRTRWAVSSEAGLFSQLSQLDFDIIFDLPDRRPRVGHEDFPGELLIGLDLAAADLEPLLFLLCGISQRIGLGFTRK
jgi:hypothetical protein